MCHNEIRNQEKVFDKEERIKNEPDLFVYNPSSNVLSVNARQRADVRLANSVVVVARVVLYIVAGSMREQNIHMFVGC